MKKYLFVFGYESPDEWAMNLRNDTDFESSQAIWVVARSEAAAMSAGCRYAQNWVGKLFEKTLGAAFPGWIAAGYAYWVDDDPLAHFSGMALDSFEEITA